jgi:hypothetical protein
MNFITSGILIANTLVWLAFTIIAFVGNLLLGFVVLSSFILFLVFYFYSNFFIISKLDKFVNTDWSIFKHKIGWANGQALIILIVAIVVGEFLGL